LFTGAAYYLPYLPTRLNHQFMELGYHVYVMATQSPDVDATLPILYATVLVLLVLDVRIKLHGHHHPLQNPPTAARPMSLSTPALEEKIRARDITVRAGPKKLLDECLPLAGAQRNFGHHRPGGERQNHFPAMPEPISRIWKTG
jgi:hypothetical protein